MFAFESMLFVSFALRLMLLSRMLNIYDTFCQKKGRVRSDDECCLQENIDD